MNRLIVCMMAVSAVAAVCIACIPGADGETVGGECGDDLSWSLDEGHSTLTIEGTGDMYDYTYGKAPWYKHRDTVRTLDFKMGAESIGDYAFANMRISSLELPATLEKIGECAFEKNDIASLELPAELRVVRDGAFRGCCKLASISFGCERVPNLGTDSFMLDDGTDRVKRCDVYSALEEGFLDKASEDMRNPLTHHVGHSLVVASGDSDGLRFPEGVTGAYDIGDIVDITPVIEDGYRFLGWSDGWTGLTRTVVFEEDAVYMALAAPEFTFTGYADADSEEPVFSEKRYAGERIPVSSIDLGEKDGLVLSGVNIDGRFYSTEKTITMPDGDLKATGVWIEAPAPVSDSTAMYISIGAVAAGLVTACAVLYFRRSAP
jgi:hypothetical protein